MALRPLVVRHRMGCGSLAPLEIPTHPAYFNRLRKKIMEMEEKTLKEIYDDVDRKNWGMKDRRAAARREVDGLGSVQKLMLVRDPSVSVKMPRGPIITPAKAIPMFREFYRNVDVEVVSVMSLNSQNEYLGLSPAGVGSLGHVEFDVAEILKVMFLHNAAAFIIAHNHPSGGTVKPSDEDLAALAELKFIGDRIRRPMRDFMIIGFDQDGGVRYYSDRDEHYDL